MIGGAFNKTFRIGISGQKYRVGFVVLGALVIWIGLSDGCTGQDLRRVGVLDATVRGEMNEICQVYIKVCLGINVGVNV